MTFFLFLFIILVRINHWSEEAQALGVLGIFVNIIFLIWAWITAPPGVKQAPTTGNPIIMAGSLITMYSVHNFLA